MSIFGSTPGQGSGGNSGSNGSPSPSLYGRGDLQAAFNWLVHQPEHIRKQASDPDRLMTLYYRSSGRPEILRILSGDHAQSLVMWKVLGVALAGAPLPHGDLTTEETRLLARWIDGGAR